MREGLGRVGNVGIVDNLAQMLSFANHSVLGVFVGMVTDSRSFASYPRHDYFRRLVCRANRSNKAACSRSCSSAITMCCI